MLEIFNKLWKKDETPRDHVLGFYDAMRPIHDALCKKWYYNIAMQAGNQWLVYGDNSNALQIPSAPDWRIRATFNKILPLSIIQRLKLMPNNPTINVRQANDISQEDAESAALARGFLRAMWKNNDFQDELDELTTWMVPCTVGYLMTIWDARHGTELAPGVGIGEAKIIAVPPFEIIPDFTYTRFKDMPRFVRATVRSIEYIEHRYGKKVEPEDIDSNKIYQMRAQATMAGNRDNLSKIMDHHAVVLDMFELPSTKYPKGFHHTCTRTTDLIVPGDMEPYYIEEKEGKKYFLNIDAAQMIRLPGMLIGTNSVEQATAPQCYLNQGKSTILENIKRLSRPKIFAPEGKIPAGALVEDPAQVIMEYDPSVEGEIIPHKPPEMAQYHLDFIKSLPAEIQDAFGIHDATTGVLPRRATSGKAISFLVEQDDERHFNPKQDIDRAIGSSYLKLLNVCANSYSEERMKDIMGDDGKILSKTISGSSLRAVDVTITRDVALPKEASARMDLAIEILGKNPTSEQLDIIFAIMQAQDIESLKALLKGNSVAQEVYAQMENYDMAKGIVRPVSPGEKHQMHKKIHEKMLAEPYNQDIKFMVMKHLADHSAQEGLEAAQKNAQVAPAGEMLEEIPQGQEAPPAPPPSAPTGAGEIQV